MPITIGQAGNNGAGGFTSITPKPDSSFTTWTAQQGTGYNGDGTRFIFVSPTGNDSNPGTLAAPKRNFDGFPSAFTEGVFTATGQGAMTALRFGMPDWICLQNGATYATSNSFDGFGSFSMSGQVINLSGNPLSSTNTPIVIAGFDWTAIQGGAMPVPNPGTGGSHPIYQAQVTSTYSNNREGTGGAIFTGQSRTTQDNIAIMGITFTTTQTGNFNGIAPGCSPPRNFFLVEDCEISNQNEGLQWGIPSAPDAYIIVRRNRILYNTGQGQFGPVATNPIYEENIVRHNGWTVAGTASVRNHNFYRGSSNIDAGTNGFSTPANEIGNVYAECGDNDGCRSGIIASNNLWLSYPIPLINFGLQTAGKPGSVDNCVFVEGVTSPVGDGAILAVTFAGTSNTSYFQGEYFNKAGATFTNNLLIHNATNTGSPNATGVTTGSGMDGIVCTGNILFDSPQWVFLDPYPGAVKTYSFTAGSGYANSTTIAGSGAQAAAVDGTGLQNATGTRFTVSNSTPIGQNNHVWVETSGRPGGDVAGLYFAGTAYLGTTTDVWFPELPFTGTCTCTIYLPFWSTSFSGGHGSGFTADIIVKAGHVINVSQCTQQDQNSQYVSIAFNGSGYQVNDVLTSSLAGGSGFSLTVTALCNNNLNDPSNSFFANTNINPKPGTWSDPSRTATKYAQTVLGLTATADRYGNSSVLNTLLTNMANFQQKGSWSGAYTAVAINNWIRAGFAGGGGGGTITIVQTLLANGFVGVPYSDQVTATGGTPPYNFTISAGALPNGLTLGPDGVIMGTPTAAGTFTFTVRATDSAASTPGTHQYTLTPAINTVMSPTGLSTVILSLFNQSSGAPPPPPPPSYTGPGDIVAANPIGYWGLRAFNAAYIGQRCARVCSSVDGSGATDINIASNGYIDTVAISHLSYFPNVAVTTLYNQSGSGIAGMDMTQATLAKMPLYNATAGPHGGPAIFSDGARNMATSASLSGVNFPTMTQTAIAKRTTVSGVNGYILGMHFVGANTDSGIAFRSANNLWGMAAGDLTQAENDNSWNSFQGAWSNGTPINLDGSGAIASGNTSYPGPDTIGQFTLFSQISLDQILTGYICESGCWQRDFNADGKFVAMNTNMQAAF
jgi:hypothetical protein